MDVLDKFDADKWADAYADMLGVDPELIVPGEQVALVRKQRAEMQQAQMQTETLDAGVSGSQEPWQRRYQQAKTRSPT